MDWLFRSDFDGITTAALWSIAAVLATTVVLFAYTMGLRVATILGQRRRTKFVDVWRKVFANAMLSEDAAENCALPRVART